MEKAIEKQAVKKVVVAECSNDFSYVKVSEMTGEDILKLSKFNANLIKQKTRRGQVQFKIVVQLDELLKKEIYLNEVQFNLILIERKLNPNVPIQHLIVPGRLIKGVSTNDVEWRRYEFFVTKNVVLSGFFTQHEVALIEVAKLKLEFIISDEKFKEEELINSLSSANKNAYISLKIIETDKKNSPLKFYNFYESNLNNIIDQNELNMILSNIKNFNK